MSFSVSVPNDGGRRKDVYSSVLKTIIAVNAYNFTKQLAINDVRFTTLELKDGRTLTDSNAIVRYLNQISTAEPNHPGLVEESLIEWEETTLEPALRQDDLTVTQIEALLRPAEKIIARGAFPSPLLNVEQIIFFGTLNQIFETVGRSKLTELPHLLEWLNAFEKLPVVAESLRFILAKIGKPVHIGPKEQKYNKNVTLKPKEKIILPKDGEKNILITSALPYVNNVPHLGNIIGSVLSADVYAKYVHSRGINSIYICGTDEYGTATETKALEEKTTPQELCNKFHKLHKEVYDWFEIDFDYFGRTTTEKQTEIAQHIFLELNKNGYLDERTETQLYCEKHNGFLADRYVEGTCPKCGYEDARGDQCDSCGNLYDVLELVNPRCKLDGTTPIPRQSKHMYLLLDKLQPQVEKWAEKSCIEGKWSRNGKITTESWFKEGLRPQCITRDLSWGTPVPLKGYENKVFYVWFDACIGYVSITANFIKDWQKWWRNPDVKLYQFMGKDNIRFHTVVFPSSQLGTKETWTMLNHIDTTEYLQYEGGKFSKSRNVGVFGNNAQETGISASVWRYYLLSSRPENADTVFSWKEFISKNNSELLANLGNFVNRVVKFINSKYSNVIPQYDPKNLENYSTTIGQINDDLSKYIELLDGCKLKQGLEVLMAISAKGNVFLQENKLDNSLFNSSPEKANAVVGVSINLIYLISALAYPYMPSAAKTIVNQLNLPLRNIPDTFTLDILAGHHINKAQYLFTKIDASKEEEWRNKYGGNSE